MCCETGGGLYIGENSLRRELISSSNPCSLRRPVFVKISCCDNQIVYQGIN